MKRWLTALLMLLNGVACAEPPERSTNDLAFIDNGKLRLGVKRSSGAGIAFLSLSSGGGNVINHWDRGRLVQQSYYGASDGSKWNKQDWRWNPVQGGGWRGEPARLLELKTDGPSLSAKSMAKHWATGADLPEVIFEQWITLTGFLAHIRFRMSYSGTNIHPSIDHELPAVFLDPQFDVLVVYEGDKPWTDQPLSRSRPGWPNESRRFDERWAAYVNGQGQGVGVLVPSAEALTCYRFGDGKAEHGSCSYLAPVKKFAIVPGLVFEYDLWLTIGSVDEIRSRFRRAAAKR